MGLKLWKHNHDRQAAEESHSCVFVCGPGHHQVRFIFLNIIK